MFGAYHYVAVTLPEQRDEYWREQLMLYESIRQANAAWLQAEWERKTEAARVQAESERQAAGTKEQPK